MKYPDQFPELQTPRLKLRALTLKDTDAIFALRSDEDVNRYIDRPPAQNVNDAENFIRRILNGAKAQQLMYWAITVLPSDELAGTIGLYNFDEKNNVGELGYEMRPRWQGKGFANEALRSVVTFGFNELQLEYITGCCDNENKASVALLEKNNFTVADESNFPFPSEELPANFSCYFIKRNT